MKNKTERLADVFGEVVEAMQAPRVRRAPLAVSLKSTWREIRTNEHGMRWFTVVAACLGLALGAWLGDMTGDLLNHYVSLR
jgi:hypothetical protein